MRLGKFERFEGKALSMASKGGTFSVRQFYFRLKSGNGEIICQSEAYTSKAMRDKGIRAVRRIAPFARVVEGN